VSGRRQSTTGRAPCAFMKPPPGVDGYEAVYPFSRSGAGNQVNPSPRRVYSSPEAGSCRLAHPLPVSGQSVQPPWHARRPVRFSAPASVKLRRLPLKTPAARENDSLGRLALQLVQQLLEGVARTERVECLVFLQGIELGLCLEMAGRTGLRQQGHGVRRVS